MNPGAGMKSDESPPGYLDLGSARFASPSGMTARRKNQMRLPRRRRGTKSKLPIRAPACSAVVAKGLTHRPHALERAHQFAEAGAAHLEIGKLIE